MMRGFDPAVARRDATGDPPGPEPGHDVTRPFVRAALHDVGAPVPADIRAGMEGAFRHDFGAVHVHSGERAARAAESLEATAFTVGEDIVLGRDARGNDARLMAHLSLIHI